MNSDLNSSSCQKPPSIVIVLTPLEIAGGVLGAVKNSTVASQVPTSFLSTSCSGPGAGACWAIARTGAAKAAARNFLIIGLLRTGVQLSAKGASTKGRGADPLARGPPRPGSRAGCRDTGGADCAPAGPWP